jgi:hypothetical protein
MDNRWWLIFGVMLFLPACGLESPTGSTPPPQLETPPSLPDKIHHTSSVEAPSLICAFSLSTAVKGYPGDNVVVTVQESEPCPVPEATWTLLTPPDGVQYRTYATRNDLLLDLPTFGPSRYLRLFSWIEGKGVCVEAHSPALGTARRIGLVGTNSQKCDEL